MPATTKFQCATRSPETGSYLCSNSSSDLGPYLKRQGYDGFIIEGKARRPVYLAILKQGVVFKDALALITLKTTETEKAICNNLGDSNLAVISAGPAVFNGVRYANIM